MANPSGPYWSEFYITDSGLRLRTEVIAEKGTIEFSRAEVGEGKPASVLSIGTMTGLATPKEDAYVVRSFVNSENNHCMIIKIDNEDFANEVLVTEVGVYAKKAGTDTEILYGYAYCLAGYAPMPAGTDGHRVWNLVFNTKISRASEVTIVYDGAGVYLSYEEFEAAISDYYTRAEVDALLVNKANVPEVEWYYPPLLNEIINVVGKATRYRKEGNVVFIEGDITNVTLNVAIFVLPEGFRPERGVAGASTQSAPAVGYPNNTARLQVGSNGDVWISRVDDISRLETGAIGLGMCFTVF